MSNALPLSDIVDVTVTISPGLPSAPTFNTALIGGTSTIISSATRTQAYGSIAAMTTAGWSSSNPEFVCAQSYFSQSPAPQYVVIGRQDLTALQTLIPHSGNAGSNFAVGDIVLVVQGGASGGLARVTAVASGAVTTLALIPGSQGTGYATASALTATAQTGTGTGLEVDITGVGETPLQALTQCRQANGNWYAAYWTSAVDADHLVIAPYIESLNSPNSTYFLTTGDATVLNNTSGNLAATLKAAGYKRTYSQYATTQSGDFPNNIYAGAAAMGYAMGANTGLPGSYFVLFGKTLVGVGAEPVNETTYQNITGNNCNVYVNYQNSYTVEQTGVSASGTLFTNIQQLDMLASDIQFSVMNVLVTQPVVPQTNAGQQLVNNTINGACVRSAIRGFLGAGIWQGATINFGTSTPFLTAGDPLPNGFIVGSPSFTTQSSGDRAAHKGMPTYVAVLGEGSIQSIVIGINATL